MSLHLAILIVGILIDRVVGDPDRLWRRFPHPVVWIGTAIAALDRRLNRDGDAPGHRQRNGVIAAALLVLGALLLGVALSRLLHALGPLGWALEALVVAVFLAQKSLVDHVRAVAQALEQGGLASGRKAVAMIVGRDADQLDAAGISHAAIESLAENASDGVVAPILWYLVLGLPGLLAYKAINTADSMIGHLSDRHRDFGRASARLDDAVNWPAARLTAALFALAAGLRARHRGLGGTVWAQARIDAPRHRSPNAGWPEAAMARALGLALGGPRRYGDLVVDAPMLNARGRRAATTADIDGAIALFEAAMTLLTTGLSMGLVACGLVLLA